MQLQYTTADNVAHDTIIAAEAEGQVTVLSNYLSHEHLPLPYPVHAG